MGSHLSASGRQRPHKTISEPLSGINYRNSACRCKVCNEFLRDQCQPTGAARFCSGSGTPSEWGRHAGNRAGTHRYAVGACAWALDSQRIRSHQRSAGLGREPDPSGWRDNRRARRRTALPRRSLVCTPASDCTGRPGRSRSERLSRCGSRSHLGRLDGPRLLGLGHHRGDQ